ncbi:MAG: hypothetical protein K8S16_12280, partial [Bacteroidales bacterium]|nr:hypothetical protein [Bacteroidales bacterium]
INKMATGNQNLYLIILQALNLAGNFAQRGNKRHRVVVISELATRAKATAHLSTFGFCQNKSLTRKTKRA